MLRLISSTIDDSEIVNGQVPKVCDDRLLPAGRVPDVALVRESAPAIAANPFAAVPAASKAGVPLLLTQRAYSVAAVRVSVVFASVPLTEPTVVSKALAEESTSVSVPPEIE